SCTRLLAEDSASLWVVTRNRSCRFALCDMQNTRCQKSMSLVSSLSNCQALLFAAAANRKRRTQATSVGHSSCSFRNHPPFLPPPPTAPLSFPLELASSAGQAVGTAPIARPRPGSPSPH